MPSGNLPELTQYNPFLASLDNTAPCCFLPLFPDADAFPPVLSLRVPFFLAEPKPECLYVAPSPGPNVTHVLARPQTFIICLWHMKFNRIAFLHHFPSAIPGPPGFYVMKSSAFPGLVDCVNRCLLICSYLSY